MDLQDPKKILDKLISICITRVGQGIVYLIFEKLLHYPQITKLKRYKKLVIQIFAKVKYLCKRFCLAMIQGQNLWNIITIIIAFDLLYEDFDITIAGLLETDNKTIDQIQSILQLKKVKNLSKQAIGSTSNLAIAFRDKNGSKKSEY